MQILPDLGADQQEEPEKTDPFPGLGVNRQENKSHSEDDPMEDSQGETKLVEVSKKTKPFWRKVVTITVAASRRKVVLGYQKSQLQEQLNWTCS